MDKSRTIRKVQALHAPLCFYCERWLGTRREDDHWPIPDRWGGIRELAACVHCHDLKDRTPLARWPEALKKLACEQLESHGSATTLMMIGVAQAKALLRRDAEYEPVIWDEDGQDFAMRVVKEVPYPGRLLLAKAATMTVDSGLALDLLPGESQWNILG